MNKCKEDKLWEDAIIIFDTSSLCAMYDMTKDAMDAMTEILGFLNDRIWLPAQVLEEYHRNREKVIANPIREKYQNPDFIAQGRTMLEGMKQFFEKHKEYPYFHPYMSEKALADCEKLRETINDSLKQLKVTIGVEQKSRKSEIEELKDVDGLRDKIDELAHGVSFDYFELMNIVQEGEVRYRNSIPPGYMDDPKNNPRSDKKGFRIFGDLIIWKEVLQEAKRQKKPVVFVCNDVKEDWYITSKDSTDKKPRTELLKEFETITGQEIVFYDLSQFVNQLETQYKDEKASGMLKGLDAVISVLAHIDREKRFATYKRDNDNLWVVCDFCKEEIAIPLNDIEWWWECEGSSERSMGPETEWISQYECECPICPKENLKFTFHIWEYPVGAFNYQSIEIEGGRLINNPDISSFIEFEDREACEICGTYDVLDENGMCEFCRDDLRRKMMDD